MFTVSDVVVRVKRTGLTDWLAGWLAGSLFVLSHNCGGGGDLGILRIQHEPYSLSHFEAPRAGEMFCEECGCSQEQNGG